MADELVEALGRQTEGVEDLEPEPSDGVEEQVESELPPLTDFGKRFLDTIEDDNTRQVAEPLIRKWDDGYSKQKTKWDEYRTQYEQLGDVEELKTGRNLYNLLMTDPMRLAEYLHQRGIIYQPEIEPEAQVQSKDEPVDPRLEKLSEAVQYLTQQTLAKEQEEQERIQLEAFNEQLNKAEEDLGPFNRQMVIALIASGAAPSIEDAVKLYQTDRQEAAKQNARKQAPSLLGSSGAPPTQPQADVRTMDNKSVVQHLTALLTPKD